MDGNSPWGGQGPSTPPSGAQPPLPTNVGAPPHPPWPPQPGGAPQRRGLLVPIGVGVAILLAAVALVVALVKGSTNAPPASTPTQAANSKPAEVFVDDADRALCLAMGPLMSENNDARKAFLESGQQNTPERKAAIPKFVSDAYEWAHRAQEVLNQHSDPPRFLTRNFQQYIDYDLLFAEGLSPDRDSSVYENQIYELGTMQLSGLIGRCSEVDAPWWN